MPVCFGVTSHIEVVATSTCSMPASELILDFFPIVMEAVCDGDLETIRSLRESGALDQPHLASEALLRAVAFRNADMIRCLRAEVNGKRIQWSSEACNIAAERGDLETLRLLRSGSEDLGGEKCEWDEQTFLRAIFGGHLDVIRYLRSKELAPKKKSGHEEKDGEETEDERCPWNEGSVFCAVEDDNLEIVKFLLDSSGENGEKCPWDEEECIRLAEEIGNADMIRFLKEASS